MSITAMKVEGPLHVICQCDKCKLEKQEPVLWQWKDSEMVTPFDKTNVEGWTPLYTIPQPQFGDTSAAYMVGVQDGKKQREWVGLTDEEIRQIALDTPIGGTNFARAIEAKLEEKNT